MPVWIRFQHLAVILWRRINSPCQSRVTNWLSMGQIWPSEVVYSAHTFHDKHYCPLFYSQPDTNLYIACLAAFVLAILILVLGLIKEAPFFNSCTMGLPTGHFQKMYSGSQNSPGKGHHLLLSSEIHARDSAAFPFNFLTQKGLTKSFFEQ